MNGRTDTERLEWMCQKSVIAIWTDKDGNLKPDSKLDYLFTNPNAPDTRFDLIRCQLDAAMDAEERR